MVLQTIYCIGTHGIWKYLPGYRHYFFRELRSCFLFNFQRNYWFDLFQKFKFDIPSVIGCPNGLSMRYSIFRGRSFYRKCNRLPAGWFTVSLKCLTIRMFSGSQSFHIHPVINHNTSNPMILDLIFILIQGLKDTS